MKIGDKIKIKDTAGISLSELEKKLFADYIFEIKKIVAGGRPSIKKQEKILKQLGLKENEIESLLFL